MNNSTTALAKQRNMLLEKLQKRIDPSNNAFSPRKEIPSPHPRLFALLIGIDFYQNVRSLRSAVADAISFKETLENHFRVPPDQIRTLLNRSASRSEILNAFRTFENDYRIQKGDPILIFYAGHGSEISTTVNNYDAKIQVLVPQDYCADPGKEVPAIPDRTIGALLSNIADSKGDNITVVFDCCHAASGTRSSERDDPRVRSVTLIPTAKDEFVDQDIWSGRSAAIPKQFQHAGLRSHILIAACSSTETSREANGHGLFSSALLRLLRTWSPDKLKYSEILKHMDVIPGQNPQCEGVNQTRALFNSKVVAPQRACFDVTLKNGGEIFLAAGAVHGIAQDAEFVIYRNAESLTDNPLGVFEINTLSPFSATLRRPLNLEGFDLDGTAVALQTKAGSKEDMRLYIPPDDNMFVCFEAWTSLMNGRRDFQNILLVDYPDDAHVELRLENGNVVFIYRDPKITQHGLSRVLFGVEPQVHELSRALKSMAHFLWKLDLNNNNSEVMSSIGFEFYRLHQPEFQYDDISNVQDMSPMGPSLHQNGVIDFVVDDEPYGIRLVNNSEYDFYPYLFYFDNSDLSITPYYESPSSGSYALDVPLKANGGTLTIGYGTGGASPFSYYLRNPQEIDVGFLKLFLSTQPVDLSNISQLTPFEDGRGPVNTSKTTGQTWGTILVPVVQRRYPPHTETHCVQCGSISAKSLDLNQMAIIHDLEYKNDMLMKELDVLRHNVAAEKETHENEILELKGKFKGREEDAEVRITPTSAEDNTHQDQHASQLQGRTSLITQNHLVEKPSRVLLSPKKKQRWSLRVKRLIHFHWA